MRSGQMADILQGHRRITNFIKEVFPDVRNVISGDSMVTYDKLATFTQDQKLLHLIRQATKDLPEDDQMLYGQIIWRTHVLIWAARHAINLDGHFAEFGVFQGYTSDVVARYIEFAKYPNKQWYLYDTFAGIPPDQLNSSSKNEHRLKSYTEQGLYEYVADKFRDIPNIIVVKGRIPDILRNNRPDKIAFLHIDMNSAQAEHDGLAAVFDQLVAGAIVIFDDYGRTPYEENYNMINNFVLQKGYCILQVPTGQGILLKR